MYCRKECGNHYVDLCTNRCCQICCSDQECYIHRRKNFAFPGNIIRGFCKFVTRLVPIQKYKDKTLPPIKDPSPSIEIPFNFDDNYVPGCKICQTNKLECTFGCGHCFCTTCSNNFKFCPYCDRYIQSRQKIYFC